ncbi:MAG: MTH1187 family thiamine-binding protein [Ignavibacteriales bacterium]
MVLLEFSMSPLDKGESLSSYISRILNYIDESGVTYKLTPMGTILEGEWDEVMGVVTGCFRLLEEDCSRISVNLKVDYRAGKESRMESKIRKVEKILNKKLTV